MSTKRGEQPDLSYHPVSLFAASLLIPRLIRESCLSGRRRRRHFLLWQTLKTASLGAAAHLGYGGEGSLWGSIIGHLLYR